MGVKLRDVVHSLLKVAVVVNGRPVETRKGNQCTV